ncbi:hypothetical protein MMC30_004371 [Trapelia coarctata]|nr:hypothetical protein [Trapelia coarctata]
MEEEKHPATSGASESAPETVIPAEKPAGPGPPPNGGLKAWLQVLGGFLLVLNTWGMANSFGVFQTYYTTTLLPTSTPSSISWIGSIQAFLLLSFGIVCGRGLDAGYFYPIALAGAFLEVFGMMMLSLSTQYYQIFLAQGLVVGLGCGCLFTPSIAIVGTYFSTKRSLATGMAASGSSIGGIIYPILIRRLIVSVGFPWAVRAMAFIMLGTLALAIALLRPRLPPRKSGPFYDLAALKDPAYTSFVLGLTLAFIAFFIPFFYAQSYALNIHMDADLSFYLLSIMNAAGMIGRLLPNAVADKVGNLNIIVPCAFLSALFLFVWIAATTQPSLIAVSVLYSFFSGGLMALPPAVIVFLAPNLQKLGTLIGMAFSAASLGVLIGSPIAGAILDAQSVGDGNGGLVVGRETYWGVFVFTGVVLVLSGLCIGVTRVNRGGWGWKKL